MSMMLAIIKVSFLRLRLHVGASFNDVRIHVSMSAKSCAELAYFTGEKLNFIEFHLCFIFKYRNRSTTCTL